MTYFWIILISVSLLSCKDVGYVNFLTDKINENFQEEIASIDAFVILPGQGCMGCISEGEQFLIDNYKKLSTVKFVLTKIVSKKILRQKIGGEVYGADNVYIDSLNIFTTMDFQESIYPTILYLDSGKILKIEYQSPNDPYAIYRLFPNISTPDVFR